MFNIIVVFIEIEEQTKRALELERERKFVQEEAERLEKDHRIAEEVKSALLQQSESQMKNQDNLVLKHKYLKPFRDTL